jgi:hypothetical protein
MELDQETLSQIVIALMLLKDKRKKPGEYTIKSAPRDFVEFYVGNHDEHRLLRELKHVNVEERLVRQWKSFTVRTRPTMVADFAMEIDRMELVSGKGFNKDQDEWTLTKFVMDFKIVWVLPKMVTEGHLIALRVAASTHPGIERFLTPIFFLCGDTFDKPMWVYWREHMKTFMDNMDAFRAEVLKNTDLEHLSRIMEQLHVVFTRVLEGMTVQEVINPDLSRVSNVPPPAAADSGAADAGAVAAPAGDSGAAAGGSASGGGAGAAAAAAVPDNSSAAGGSAPGGGAGDVSAAAPAAPAGDGGATAAAASVPVDDTEARKVKAFRNIQIGYVYGKLKDTESGNSKSNIDYVVDMLKQMSFPAADDSNNPYDIDILALFVQFQSILALPDSDSTRVSLMDDVCIKITEFFLNAREYQRFEKSLAALRIQYHPDKNGNSPESTAITQDINHAATILNDLYSHSQDKKQYFPVKASAHFSGLEAAHDGVPGHGEDPAELGIGEVVVDVLHGEAEVDPALEAESHEAHGLRGHPDGPELPVGQPHGLELLAGGLEPYDVGEVSVQVVDGVGGPVRELDGVAGLAASVEHPQPDVGLELPELAGGDLPLEQPVEVDGLVLLDVPPAEGGLELGAPAVDACALGGAQADEHVDAAGFPLYLESRALQQDLTVRDPFQLRFDLTGIHP